MKNVIRFAVIIGLSIGAFASTMPDADAATLRNAAMVSAETQKGARYVYGAEGGYSRGYDCSGLVWWAYKKHGKTLPRTAAAQYNKSKHISAGSLQPGDLVFIRDRRSVYHVGIYIGKRYGKPYMVNANTGSYRGRKVVDAPISEYTAGAPYAVYGRY